MHKIDGAGHIANSWVSEDVPTNRPPTEITSDWMNAIQEELVNLATINGEPLVKADNSQVKTELIKRFSIKIAVAAGTADALTADFTPDLVLTNGQPFYIRSVSANTVVAPTLNVDATGVKTVVKGNNLPLVAGDILGGGAWLTMQYDLALDKYVLLNPATGLFAVGYIPGTILHWPSMAAPSWALVRDGAAVSRTAYSTLLGILCPTQSGILTNGANTVTGLTTTRQMAIGNKIEGVGVPAGATIASITGATSITLSANATVTGAQILRLFPYGSGDGATTFNVMDDRELFERSYAATPQGFDKSDLTGNTTNASAAITNLSTTDGMYIGQGVSGSGIPGGATIASITSLTAITISANATATATAALLTFSGRAFGRTEDDQFKSHTHLAGFSSQVTGANGAGSYWMGLAASTTPTAASGTTETRPRNRAYLPIIVY